MHDLERLYLIAAWSYILAFNLTYFALTHNDNYLLKLLYQDPMFP